MQLPVLQKHACFCRDCTELFASEKFDGLGDRLLESAGGASGFKVPLGADGRAYTLRVGDERLGASWVGV